MLCRLDISIQSFYSKKAEGSIPVLSVVDDGCGMSHGEIINMLSFGHKLPDADDPDRIGRFGIGFKVFLYFTVDGNVSNGYVWLGFLVVFLAD